MIIINETASLWNFDAWSGAVSTKNRIIEAGMCDEFDALIEECFPEGLTDVTLNDILWFDSDWIYETLGIKDEEDDEEENEEEDDEDEEENEEDEEDNKEEDAE